MGDESHASGQEKVNGSLNLVLDDIKEFAKKGAPPAPKVDESGNREFEQKWRLFEKRLDYGWNFFDYHAKQRMSMFNYFLIFVGFNFAGYAGLAKDGDFGVAAMVASLGAILTIFFLFLERRNEELVHISEDLLLSLESDVLFAEYDKEMPWPHRRGRWEEKNGKSAFHETLWPFNWSVWSKMNTERKVKPSGIFRRQTSEEKECGRSRCEHGRWLPGFQIAVVFVFLFLALFSAYKAVYPTVASADSAPALPPPHVTVPVFVTVPAPVCPAINMHGAGGHGSGGHTKDAKTGPCK